MKNGFQDVKNILMNPLVMNRRTTGEDLQIYLGVFDTVVSAVLLQEKLEPRLVYFVSRTLQDTKTLYQQVEKVAMALIHAARRLKPYF